MALPDLSPRFVILAAVVTFVGGVSYLLEIRGSVTPLQKRNFVARLAFVSLVGLVALLLFTFLAGQVWDRDVARTYSPWVIAFSIIVAVQIVTWHDAHKVDPRE